MIMNVSVGGNGSEDWHQQFPLGAGENITYYHYNLDITDLWISSPEYALGLVLRTYLLPVIVALGTIGNVLSIVVLSRKNLRQTALCFYIAVFCITNTLVLYMGCGLDWLALVSKKPHIPNLADWICKLWKFVFNVILYSVGWMVVAMTIDRFIYIWHPIKAQQMCTVFIAKVSTVFIFIGLISISIHAMWSYYLSPATVCVLDHTLHAFQTKIWPWISACVYVYLPTSLIIIFSIFLLTSLIGRPFSNSHQDQLSKITLAVATMYLCLQLPSLILNIVMHHKGEWTYSYKALFKVWLADRICQLLSCTFHSLSFLCFYTFGSMFRKEVCSLSTCLRKRNHTFVELRQGEGANGLLNRHEDGPNSTTV